MLRYLILLLSLTIYLPVQAQPLITEEEAVQRALKNQRNLRAANLSIQQQQQLLRGAAGIDNPQVTAEGSPYEPLVIGVQQSFSLPGVYRNRRALQGERIRLAQLQLQGSQLDLNREVRLTYLELQYLTERERLLRYQDSIYSAIKVASKRFFEAGQINKLEELQATSQADQVHNNFVRVQTELAGSRQVFRFFINYADTFRITSIQQYIFVPTGDTAITNVQQQILQQQVAISQRELQAERSELLPQFQAGLLFPTTRNYERAIGYQAGVAIPIWRRQNRSRIAAAQTGVDIARAQQELEQQRLRAQYQQAVAVYQRELQSLNYFNSTALPQARAIIETSQRLFHGGELNYIESLRNLASAFDIFYNHIDTHRAYNEAVIQLNYLNGRL